MTDNNLKIPRGVWVLGFVSLLMDVSSELIHSLLPMFMVTTLGISVLSVGVIEGLAESTALIVKVFSGALSDYLGKRKILALLGYGLGAFTKPVFALAQGMGMVLAARCAGCRHHAAGDTRRGIRLAPVAGYRGGFPRAAARDRADAVVGGRFPFGVLGGGDPRHAGGVALVVRRARTAAA